MASSRRTLSNIWLVCSLIFSIVTQADQSVSHEKKVSVQLTHSYFPESLKILDADFSGTLSRDELIAGYYLDSLADADYLKILSLLGFTDSTEGHESNDIPVKQFVSDPVWQFVRSERDPRNLIFPNGLESIHFSNVDQGGIPDCVLIASIISMLRTESGRRKVMNMIEVVDSVANVRFPGLEETIPVNIVEVMNQATLLQSSSPDSGLWLAILERAFAEFVYDDMDVPKYEQDTPTEPYNSEFDELPLISQLVFEFLLSRNIYLSWLSPQVVNTVLSGTKSYYRDTSGYTNEEMHRCLSDITETSEVLQAGTHTDDPSYPELDRGHAYGILKYDNIERRVWLRNPYGSWDLRKPASVLSFLYKLGNASHETVDMKTGKALDGVNNGVFSLTLEEFNNLFLDIVFDNPISDNPTPLCPR